MHSKTNSGILFISEGLSKQKNEGFNKYASKLAELLKRKGACIVGWGDMATSPMIDIRLKKLCAPSCLWQMMRRKEKTVVLAPWVIDRWALLFLLLMQLSGKKCKLLLIWHPNHTGSSEKIIRFGFRLYHPELYLTSEELYRNFVQWYPGKLHHMSAAVDTRLYHPVSPEEKLALRRKYGLPEDKPLLFHAGHIIRVRRLEWMLELPEDTAGVLAASPFWTPQEPINHLLREKENVTILDGYYPDIQELFQACDCYVFTPQSNGAIQTPLSVFEAMACNLYVVSTRHGELQAVEEGDGLRYVEGSDPAETVQAALQLLREKPVCRTREKALRYDWSSAADLLLQNNN